MLIMITKRYFKNDVDDQKEAIPDKMLSQWVIEFSKELDKIIFTAPKLKKDLYLFQPADSDKLNKKLKKCAKQTKFSITDFTVSYTITSSLNYETAQHLTRDHQPVNIIKYGKGLPVAMTQTNKSITYKFEPNEFLPTRYHEQVLIPQGAILKYVCNLNEVDDNKYSYAMISNMEKLVKIKNKFTKDYNVVDWSKNPLNVYIATPEEKAYMKMIKGFFKKSKKAKEELPTHFENPISKEGEMEVVPKPDTKFPDSSDITSSDLEYIYFSNVRIVNKMATELTKWHKNLSLYNVCILSVYINDSSWLSDFYFKNNVNTRLLKQAVKYLGDKFEEFNVKDSTLQLVKLVEQLVSQDSVSKMEYVTFLTRYAADLNTVILSAPPLVEDVYLFQGVKNTNLSKELGNCKTRKGVNKIFAKNVVSTTTNFQVANRFIDDDKKCCVNLIKYKKGMPFLMIQSEEDDGSISSRYKFKPSKYLRTWGEEEVLLPQGLRFDYECMYNYSWWGDPEPKPKYVFTTVQMNKDLVKIKNKFNKDVNVIDWKRKPYKSYVSSK